MGTKRKIHKKKPAINDLIEVMAQLRAPGGCPWDREQDHKSIRFHAVEEVYELIDAIEMEDDHEMLEECGDLLLQVVFHCQLAKERKAFDFEKAARTITDKLIRRHPHVFSNSNANNVDAVWAQWEKIKREEKKGTQHERSSVLDGIPRHLPALQRAEKLIKKARKNGLTDKPLIKTTKQRYSKETLSKELFALAEYAQSKGWQPEALLRAETKKQERNLRKKESRLTN
ncbi:MAG: MazG family protein [Verrucomicrobiales bacterium]|nr:MazG family protein [Verrucomicrobiales bacterium]